jgi:hypothetical protein
MYSEVIRDTQQCHQDRNWTQDNLWQELVGTYDWTYVEAFSFGAYSSETDFKGYVLTLNSDSTFFLNLADTATVSGVWDLENSWLSFSLIHQPYAPTLWGELMYCEPHLVFYSSPVDGPDHLYTKR